MTLWDPRWALELALGTLEGEERDAALAVLARDPSARAELAAARELLGALPAAPTEAPPAALRSQVLAATAPASACLGGFARRTAELFDRDEEGTRDLLSKLDALTFEPSPLPGVELAHVEGGPRTGGADVGFVRFAAGLRFPRHEHAGAEQQLVLSGSFTDDDGREYLPGDVLVKPAGSTHTFVVGDAEPCVIALVLDAPIRLV